MTIAGIDTAAEQLLFTWFDPDNKSNGYLRADLDGGNGIKSTLHIGVDDENKLKNIYIRGDLDTSPPPRAYNREEIEEQAEEGLLRNRLKRSY